MGISAEQSELQCRLALDRDMDTIYELYMDESSNLYLTYDPISKNNFEKIYDDVSSTNTLYVAEMGDKVIGSYRLIPKTYRQAHTIYLGGFVIDRSMKGKGIGTQILNHIRSESARQGKKRIELTVDIANEAAIKLYKKIGFVIEGHIRHSYKRSPENHYLDEYLMGLLL